MFAELHWKPFETEKKLTVLDSPKSNLHGLVNTTNTNEHALPLDLRSAVNKTVSSSDEYQSDNESEQELTDNDLTTTNGYSSAPNTQGGSLHDEDNETIPDNDNIPGISTDNVSYDTPGKSLSHGNNLTDTVISTSGSDNQQTKSIHPTQNTQSDGCEPRRQNILPTDVTGLNAEVPPDCKITTSTDANSDGGKQPETKSTGNVIGINVSDVE